jgi:hypothetical protein
MNASKNTRTAIEKLRRQADATCNPAFLDTIADQFDLLGQYGEATKLRIKADAIRRASKQPAEEWA